MGFPEYILITREQLQPRNHTYAQVCACCVQPLGLLSTRTSPQQHTGDALVNEAWGFPPEHIVDTLWQV